MPIIYKIDILKALKEHGFTTYRIRKEKLFSESTLQAFRNGVLVSYDTLCRLCNLLCCDVGDLLEYQEDTKAH